MANDSEFNLSTIWETDCSIGRKLLGTLFWYLTRWYFWILTIVIVVGMCTGGGDSTTNLSSIEDAQKYISGKIFIGSPTNDLWYKIEFSESRATLWVATPQSGHWGSAETSSSYNVREDRYIDDGKTYYYVMIGDYYKPLSYYKFDITAKRLYLNAGASRGQGTPMKKGDRNPWN